jgi:CrcB protein
MKVLLEYMAIGAAGFLGAVARVAVARAMGRFFPVRFPVGTLVINVTGSFILGFFLTNIADRPSVSDTTRLAIGAGFVGAYTTFSTFMFESNALVDEGAGFQAIANLFGSLLLGLLAVRAGILVGRRF